MKIFKSLSILALSLFLFLPRFSNAGNNYEATVDFSNIGSVPLNAVRLSLMNIEIEATQEDISVSEIWLKRNGLSSWSDFGNVWAQTDSYHRSLRSRVNSNDDVRIRFLRPIKIPKGQSEKFEIYINLNLKNSGKTFNFSLENIVTNKENSAKLSRYRGNYSSSYLESSGFSIPAMKFAPLGSSTYINVGSNSEIGKFRLSNSGNKDVMLKSIRLKNYGKSDLSTDFSNWTISNNGQQISSNFSSTRDYISFFFDDYVIGAGNSVILKINSQLINSRTNNTVQLGIQYSSDILAEIKNTGANASTNFESKKLKKHNLRSGNLAIIKSYQSNYSSKYRTKNNYSYTNSRRTYSPGSKDVLFLHKYLNERYDFRAEGIFIPVTSNQDKESLESSYNDFRLYVDGNFAGSSNDFEYRNGRLGLFFNDNFEGNKRAEIRIIGRISYNAKNGNYLNFSLPQSELIDQEYYWQ